MRYEYAWGRHAKQGTGASRDPYGTYVLDYTGRSNGGFEPDCKGS